MKKKSWIKVLTAAVALCLTAVGCSKDSGTTPEQEFKDNYLALVMGGKQVDSLQDWSTSTGLSLKISVDYGNSMDYKVYILPTPAIYDASATYLGMACLKSGESKTITVCRPAHNVLLYAACFDSDGHAVCKAFPVKASNNEVVFNGQQPETKVDVQQPTGGMDERWSVPIMQMPDLSDYTTGPFIEASTMEAEPEGNDRLRLSISNDYTGYLPSLGIRGNMSVYVSGTWTLSFNQRVANGNVLVVGSGGKVIIPEGMTLSATSSANGATGQIYILPGGEVTGDGTLEYNTGEGSFSYNSGIISTHEIRLNGCSLYNGNILGSETDTPTSVNCVAKDGTQGVLINRGGAWLQQINGDNLSLQNASYMNVNSEVTLSESSRLDDWSFIECPSLVLNGSTDGSKVVYMGNGATIEASDITVHNFGVWGPVGNNFSANALLKVDNCNGCETTVGQAGTYLLDHVELILPEDFPVDFDADHLSDNNRLFFYWLNACEGRLINDNNYRWTLVGNKDALVWNDDISANACGDDTRQTCTYSTSASYSTTYLTKGSTTVPEPNGMFYAFETIQSSMKDYDYNDVVLRVGVPIDNGDGRYVSNVLVMCVGNTIKTNIIYNGSDFGDEVHSVIGVADDKTANNNTSINRVFSRLGEITFPDGNARIDQLSFSVRLEDANGNTTTMETGETPLFIVINGSSDRRWFWPSEGVNIGVAYPQFSTWASNMLTAIRWYDSSNAAAGKVITWTSADE